MKFLFTDNQRRLAYKLLWNQLLKHEYLTPGEIQLLFVEHFSFLHGDFKRAQLLKDEMDNTPYFILEEDL